MEQEQRYFALGPCISQSNSFYYSFDHKTLAKELNRDARNFSTPPFVLVLDYKANVESKIKVAINVYDQYDHDPSLLWVIHAPATLLDLFLFTIDSQLHCASTL